MYGATAMASKEDLNLPNRSRYLLPECNTNLLRYQSAPRSLLGELCDDFLPVKTTSSTSTSGTFSTGFIRPDLQIGDKTSGGGAATSAVHGLLPLPLPLPPQKQQLAMAMFHPQTQLKQQQTANRAYSVVGSTSMGMDTAEQFHKRSSSSNPNLARQSSSPAGLFSHLHVDNSGFGYGMVRGGQGNAMSGLKKPTSLSTSTSKSKQNSSMSQISEVAVSGNSLEESGSFGAFRGNNNYLLGLSSNNSAWEINLL